MLTTMDGIPGSNDMRTVLRFLGTVFVGLLVTGAGAVCSAQSTRSRTTTQPELVTQSGHSTNVVTIAFSSDGRILASNSQGTIKLWDVVTGKQLRTLNGSGSAFAISPDGKKLAVGDSLNTIALWDVATGDRVGTFVGTPYLNCLVFSPDGQRLASSGTTFETTSSGTFTSLGINKVWDVLTGRELLTLEGSDGLSMMQFSSDGRLLIASRLPSSRVTIWDSLTGKKLSDLEGLSLPFTHGGKLIVENHSYTFNPPVGVGYDTVFSPDFKTVASHESNKIKLSDVATGRERRTFGGHSPPIYGLAVSPDGRTVAAGVGGGPAQVEGSIRLWDLTNKTTVRTLPASGYFTSLAFSPDSKLLASGNALWYGEIVLWDVQTGSKVQRYQPPNSPSFYTLAFSTDGRILAAGSLDTKVRLLAVPTLAEVRTLTGHSAAIDLVRFSPDGQTLGSVSTDGMVKLWNVSSGAELYSIKGHSNNSVNFDRTSIAFSPDGKLLARGSRLAAASLWDVASGTLVHTFDGPGELVGFSPDGKLLAIGDLKGTVLWDISSRKEMSRLAAVGSLFSPTDDYLFSTNPESGVSIWNFRERDKLASLIPFGNFDWLVVTPDGLFDGSAAAWRQVLWRFNNNTFDNISAEAFFNEFYYPGLLGDIFGGKRPKAPSEISKKDRRQPEVKLIAADSLDTNLTTRHVTIKIRVSEVPADEDDKKGSGARDVRLFRNGSLVKHWAGDVLKGQSNVTLDAAVPIIAGKNTLTVYAFNDANIRSEDATLTLTGADSLKRKGTLYILAIGVGKYANQEYNLNYTPDDATSFASQLKLEQERLGQFQSVEIKTLLNENAQKENILRELKRVAASVQPEDVLVVYFSGHGKASGDHFYLVPHDLGYAGARDRVTGPALKQILAHSISDLELEETFRGIDAGQIFMIIDACNSGQALENKKEPRRGPMNTRGLAQLAYEKGMYILTASQNVEEAFVSEKLKHSYLTYALIEDGLKTAAADTNLDGELTLREWFDYAVNRVPKLREETLQSKSLEEVTPAVNAVRKQELQTPRVFYRPEPDALPFIVAKRRHE